MAIDDIESYKYIYVLINDQLSNDVPTPNPVAGRQLVAFKYRLVICYVFYKYFNKLNI
jgi:hypothetical protein